MLCVARQARTAYSNGPSQNRRCVAGQELRSTYTTTLYSWQDIQGDAHQYNATAERALDAAYTRVANWRNSGAATTLPLMTTDSNIKCYRYNGVANLLGTTNNLVLSGIQKVTVVTLYRNFSATSGALHHYNTVWSSQTQDWFIGGTSTSCTAATRGNVGTSSRTWSSTQNVWTVNASIFDKTVAAAQQLKVFENGTQVTVFTSTADAANTNDFGSFLDFTSYQPYASSLIAAMMVFTTNLSAAQIASVTQLIRWRAGFSI